MENTSAAPAEPSTDAKVSPLREDLRPSALAPEELAELQQASNDVLQLQARIGAIHCDQLVADEQYTDRRAQSEEQVKKLRAQLDGHARVIDAARTRLVKKYGLAQTSKLDLKTGEIIY